MFDKLKRKKVHKRLDNDYATLESYTVRINAAKTLVGNDSEILEELRLLQNDLHYNVATLSKTAKKDLDNITDGIDQILKMLRGDDWDKEVIIKKIKIARADISMHGAHNIK